jgi:hypothetical protein
MSNSVLPKVTTEIQGASSLFLGQKLEELAQRGITIAGRINTDRHSSLYYNETVKNGINAIYIGGTIKANATPLDTHGTIQAFAQMITGILGVIGAIWIIYHYGKRKILNNIAGLIIYATAFTDVVQGAYYSHEGVSMYTKYEHYADWSAAVRNNIFNAKEAIFTWSAISSSLLVALLASNTLYVVRFGGTAKNLDRLKYVWVFLCFILPFFIYFVPVSIGREQPLFWTRNRSRTAGECISFFHCDFQLYWFGILMTFNFVFSLIAYFLASIAIMTNYSTSNRIDSGVYSDSSSRAKNAVSKLIKLYSVSILIGWIPYLIRYWYVRAYGSLAGMNSTDPLLADWLDTIRSFTAPIRGYLHALAVHIVNRSVLNVVESSNFRRLFNIIFLVSPKEEDIKSGTQHIPSIERSLQEPQWEISFQGEDTQVSQYSQMSMSRLSKV